MFKTGCDWDGFYWVELHFGEYANLINPSAAKNMPCGHQVLLAVGCFCSAVLLLFLSTVSCVTSWVPTHFQCSPLLESATFNAGVLSCYRRVSSHGTSLRRKFLLDYTCRSGMLMHSPLTTSLVRKRFRNRVCGWHGLLSSDCELPVIFQ